MRIVLTGPGDAAMFGNLHDDVFDAPPDPNLLSCYLDDPRLHMAVARDGGRIVGMVTGIHYHHPDKKPQMWINELGVAGPWRRLGVGTRLIAALTDHARSLDCTAIWVIADPTDLAENFYTSLGWCRTGERLAMFSRSLGVPSGTGEAGADPSDPNNAKS